MFADMVVMARQQVARGEVAPEADYWVRSNVEVQVDMAAIGDN